MKKEMSPSQRQAVITLIEKQEKERPRTYLENWRPISLTNAKIMSKVIATRIVKVLPQIIHSNQTGSVSSRYIGEAAKSILDIMDYIPRFLLFIDFEKAFNMSGVEFYVQMLRSLWISTQS